MAIESMRDIPNEAACPVSMEVLALLLRTDGARRDAILDDLGGTVRAALALFCYGRCHLRSLSFTVAARCERRALVALAGIAGGVLYDQAQRKGEREPEERPSGRSRVSLARCAA